MPRFTDLDDLLRHDELGTGDWLLVDQDRIDGFARPADLAEALDLLGRHPGATVVAGATDLGVEANLRGRRPSYVIAIDRLPELREVSTDGTIEIGCHGDDDGSAMLLAHAVGAGLRVASFARAASDLEELFLQVTSADAASQAVPA